MPQSEHKKRRGNRLEELRRKVLSHLKECQRVNARARYEAERKRKETGRGAFLGKESWPPEEKEEDRRRMRQIRKLAKSVGLTDNDLNAIIRSVASSLAEEEGVG